jgi:hypothetical protein
MSGSIPPSFTKMTLLEMFNVIDQCLSGTIPDFTNASKIRVFSISNNAELSGSLNGFCNGTEFKNVNTTIVTDCGGIECDCCEECCTKNEFDSCDNQTGKCWKSLNVDNETARGFIPNLEKQCLRFTGKQCGM